MKTPYPNFIVGIGGSAGGLIAYKALLDALPSNTGMAFVIVSHIVAHRQQSFSSNSVEVTQKCQ